MVKTRLNVFQRVIRQWDRVHPYNAAQVMRVRAHAERCTVTCAWEAALGSMGLGRLVVDGSRYGFEPAPTRTAGLAVLPDSTSLDAHLNAEMNRPFARGEIPFRPFMRPMRDGTWQLGVIYQHWLADSVSIQMLMRQWLLRLCRPEAAVTTPPPQPAGGYWRYFGPGAAQWRLIPALASMVPTFFRYRHARKVRTRGSTDHTMQFHLHRLPAGWVESVRQGARARGVTMSELFLLVIAEVCAAHVPMQRSRSRDCIGVGAIVDLRPLSRRLPPDTFGLFLGFANVLLPQDELHDTTRQLRSISMQMEHSRRRRTPAVGQLWLAAGLTARCFRPVTKFYQYYRKYMPLIGGLSNIDMNRTWAADLQGDLLLEYMRVSPTGPMVPVVFTTTTLGSDMCLAVAARRSVVSSEAIHSMAEQFVRRAAELAGRTETPIPAVRAGS